MSLTEAFAASLSTMTLISTSLHSWMQQLIPGTEAVLIGKKFTAVSNFATEYFQDLVLFGFSGTFLLEMSESEPPVSRSFTRSTNEPKSRGEF